MTYKTIKKKDNLLGNAVLAAILEAPRQVLVLCGRVDEIVLGAALAWMFMMERRGADVLVLCPKGVPTHLQHLEGSELVASELKGRKDVALVVGEAESKMDLDFSQCKDVIHVSEDEFMEIV